VAFPATAVQGRFPQQGDYVVFNAEYKLWRHCIWRAVLVKMAIISDWHALEASVPYQWTGSFRERDATAEDAVGDTDLDSDSLGVPAAREPGLIVRLSAGLTESEGEELAVWLQEVLADVDIQLLDAMDEHKNLPVIMVTMTQWLALFGLAPVGNLRKREVQTKTRRALVRSVKALRRHMPIPDVRRATSWAIRCLLQAMPIHLGSARPRASHIGSITGAAPLLCDALSQFVEEAVDGGSVHVGVLAALEILTREPAPAQQIVTHDTAIRSLGRLLDLLGDSNRVMAGVGIKFLRNVLQLAGEEMGHDIVASVMIQEGTAMSLSQLVLRVGNGQKLRQLCSQLRPTEECGVACTEACGMEMQKVAPQRLVHDAACIFAKLWAEESSLVMLEAFQVPFVSLLDRDEPAHKLSSK